MKRFLILLFVLFLILPLPVNATDAATDITESTQFSGSGFYSLNFLRDKNIDKYVTSEGSASITLQNPDGIGSLYLLFDLEYGAYTVTDNATGQRVTAGQQGFLHEYLDLTKLFGAPLTSVTLEFGNGPVRLSEVYVFSPGSPPDFVQLWQPPLDGKADIVLFSTHGDDEQLYFAGLLPYYAGELGCGVQVVYLTDHRNFTLARTHEMLNGLWSVGVTAYPVFGGFADFRIDSLQGTYDHYASKYSTSKEDLQSFVVEQIRRFRPQVAIGHDIKGEYGHGMHRVYTDLLINALELTGNPEIFPESAEKHGLWQIPKLYLHLYPESPIVLDYDTPLSRFDGLTAFQVSQQLGFPCHKSQQQFVMFGDWLYGYNGEITKASQISNYSPCQFGLYHSAVGPDVQKNDFLENITTYARQEQLEQERVEQERLEQEKQEQERLEQEKLEQERLEQEKLEQERLEQERLEQERLAQKKAQRSRYIAVFCLALLFVISIAVPLHERKQPEKTGQKQKAKK